MIARNEFNENYIDIHLCLLVEKCIDTDEGTMNNLAVSPIPGDYGTSHGFTASNIPGQHLDSTAFDVGKMTGNHETGNRVGGTNMSYPCDYYKHNAEKCGKHGNNEDGKCCSCKPAGNVIFFHIEDFFKSVSFNFLLNKSQLIR